jgi:hypothetical protein
MNSMSFFICGSANHEYNDILWPVIIIFNNNLYTDVIIKCMVTDSIQHHYVGQCPLFEATDVTVSPVYHCATKVLQYLAVLIITTNMYINKNNKHINK